MKLHSLNTLPLKTSLPFALNKSKVHLNKPAPHPASNQNVDYLVKGVISGDLHDQNNLDEIGKSENYMATIVTFSKGTTLPQFLHICRG